MDIRKTFLSSISILFGFVASEALAVPIIQEVLYDGPGADADDVFTEIYGTPGMSLDGWTLVGINGANNDPYRIIDLTGGVIPTDGIFVIATSSANASLTLVRDFIANVDFQNGNPDAIQLRDPLDVVIDSLTYGTNAWNLGSDPGEGNHAIDVNAGFSLSRDLLGTDTNDNATDFAQSTPTPGIGPTPPAPPPTDDLPEPAPIAIIGFSIAGLGLLARRRRRHMN